GHRAQPLQERSGVPPSVCDSGADEHLGAVRGPAVCLGERAVGGADAGCVSQVDAEFSSCHGIHCQGGAERGERSPIRSARLFRGAGRPVRALSPACRLVWLLSQTFGRLRPSHVRRHRPRLRREKLSVTARIGRYSSTFLPPPCVLGSTPPMSAPPPPGPYGPQQPGPHSGPPQGGPPQGPPP